MKITLALLPFTVLAVSLAALGAPSPRANHVMHEKRAHDPLDWALARRAEPDRILPLRIGLTQSNLEQLEDLLMSMSHPESPDYGKHWTPARVVEHFAPAPETVDRVAEWLRNEGIAAERVRMSPSRGWIEVANATVKEVEKLLGTEYHIFTHQSGVEQISCDRYHVPSHLTPHIDLITPTVHFNHRVPSRSTPAHKRQLGKSNIHSHLKGMRPLAKPLAGSDDLSNCDAQITPACLRALYNVDYTPVATAQNSYGIVEFTPQAFLQNDLNIFFRNFTPTIVGTPAATPVLVSIDGGVDQTTQQSFNFNGESDLDLEYAMALTSPQPITLLQTGDLVEGASFNNWLDAVDGTFCTFDGGDDPTQDGIYPDNRRGGFNQPESCGILAPPNVVSVSYGQDESSVTARYANRQCTEYGKIGMLGSTVLYSSGDDGVAGNGGGCLGANGRPARNGQRFNPGFPVTCPFITAVGATQVDPGSTVDDPEGACEQVIFSGGGFSNIFAIPSYQQTAVADFLANHPPPFTSAQFNNTGNSRAFPDLSANGANYVIGIDGGFSLVFGTSASSPVVGSLITLVNDARIAAGKGPVGFINPTIYSSQFASAFNDITHGGNQGCGTPGFTAVAGWDPVTGVGTPDLGKLMQLWLALP